MVLINSLQKFWNEKYKPIKTFEIFTIFVIFATIAWILKIFTNFLGHLFIGRIRISSNQSNQLSICAIFAYLNIYKHSKHIIWSEYLILVIIRWFRKGKTGKRIIILYAKVPSHIKMNRKGFKQHITDNRFSQHQETKNQIEAKGNKSILARWKRDIVIIEPELFLFRFDRVSIFPIVSENVSVRYSSFSYRAICLKEMKVIITCINFVNRNR